MSTTCSTRSVTKLESNLSAPLLAKGDFLFPPQLKPPPSNNISWPRRQAGVPFLARGTTVGHHLGSSSQIIKGARKKRVNITLLLVQPLLGWPPYSCVLWGWRRRRRRRIRRCRRREKFLERFGRWLSSFMQERRMVNWREAGTSSHSCYSVATAASGMY